MAGEEDQATGGQESVAGGWRGSRVLGGEMAAERAETMFADRERGFETKHFFGLPGNG